MKRRDFFGTSGCGLAGFLLASLGTGSCKKKAQNAPTASAAPTGPTPEEQAADELASRKASVKKILMENLGKTEKEADARLADLEQKLDAVKNKCVCETCPSYLPEESGLAFCHAFIGRSKLIKDEKGCDCGQCPVHKEMGLKFSYYCTRDSELDQEVVKT